MGATPNWLKDRALADLAPYQAIASLGEGGTGRVLN